MSYFVFDLDETLGELYTPYYFLCDLKFQKFTQDIRPAKSQPPPPELEPTLSKAYKQFVAHTAASETSDKPLGILRPGILEIFEKIAELKSRGLVKGVLIYSNNGSLPALEFTRDVIEEAIGSPGLICDCIHWYHPMRRAELIRGYNGRTSPGKANKTWAILSRIMKEGPCAAPADLDPSQVYFFDDTIHPNLRTALGERYTQVTPYEYKTNVGRIARLYRLALENAGILGNKALENSFLDYVAEDCMGVRSDSIEEHIGLITKYTTGTAAEESLPPAPDAGFTKMNALLDSLLAKANANYQKQINTTLFDGGRRGRIVRRRVATRKFRRGSKKTRKSNRRSRK